MAKIVDGAGNTLNKAALIAKGTTVTQPTKYTINEDIYVVDSYPGDKTVETRRKKLFYQGQIVGADVIDALAPYTAAVVSSVSPSAGLPAAGGTVVTVTGTGFNGVTSVTFGGTAGTALKVVSTTQLRVTAPAKTAGAHAVVVVNAAGNSNSTVTATYV